METLEKNVFLFWICLSLILFNACTSTSTSGNAEGKIYTVPVRDKISDNDLISLKDDIAKVEYVQLETNDSCLISNIISLQLTKEYIFAYNGKTDQVFQFDRKGKFIRQVGRLGSGPGEYSLITEIAADEESRELYLFQYGDIPLVYSFDGKFLRSDSIIGTNLHPTASGNHIIKGLTMLPKEYSPYPYMAYVQSKDKKILSSVIPYNKSWDEEFNFMQDIVFCKSLGGSALVHTECNDTVFRVSDSGIEPVCVLEKKNSVNYNKNIADIRIFKENPVEDKDIQLADMFETNKYIYFRFMFAGSGDIYIQRLSKKDGQLLSHKVNEKYIEAGTGFPMNNLFGLENDFDGGAPFYPMVSVDDNTVAQLIPSYLLVHIKDEGLLPALPEELAGINENANPVVALFTFK